MFFKHKKSESETNSDLIRCESPTCPSPDVLRTKETTFDTGGFIVCEFCYTKYLADNPIEQVSAVPKTKKVETVEITRINRKPQSWEVNNNSDAHLSRIGPSNDHEKYAEELSIWKAIFNHLRIDQRHVKIKHITKLSQTQHTRLVETEIGSLALSLITKQEQSVKDKEEKLFCRMFEIEFPVSSIYELENLPSTIKEWFINNKMVVQNTSFSDYTIRLLETEDKLTSLEVVTDKMLYVDLEPFMFELGRYFYFLQFIGCQFPYQIYFTSKNDTITFFNSNFPHNNESFNDSKTALQHLYHSIPFMLDEIYFQQFKEGVESEHKHIETLIARDENTKMEIEQFFKHIGIQFDASKPLPALNL